MGTDIDQEEFGESDYSRFAERLGQCLSALGQLLERPGFGVGPTTVGAELELFLVDGAGRPFAALGGELNVLLDRVADAAKDHAGRLALIGILPTLSQADLGPGLMTDVPRYW